MSSKLRIENGKHSRGYDSWKQWLVARMLKWSGYVVLYRVEMHLTPEGAEIRLPKGCDTLLWEYCKITFPSGYKVEVAHHEHYDPAGETGIWSEVEVVKPNIR